MKKPQQGFLRGTLVLTGAALAAKLLGALFRIPLTAQLGGAGMGCFGSAYGRFMPRDALLVTGLSAAVARPAAALQGNPAAARRLLTVARRFALAAGLMGMLAAAGLSGLFLKVTGSTPEALPAMIALSPAVLLCCLSAVERGFREGQCRMEPTALSQLAEALVKLLAGLTLTAHAEARLDYVNDYAGILTADERDALCLDALRRGEDPAQTILRLR